MEIKSLNKKTTLYSGVEGDGYVLAFGAIKKASDTTTILVITGNNLTDVTLTKTCGCSTTISKKLSENIFEGSVKYDALQMGEFNKTIKVDYTENGTKKKTTIKLKGTVI